MIRAALPNPAHLALAELAAADRVQVLVTQNVDGQHERSGFPGRKLVNVHGTDSAVVCLGCGRREPREVMFDRAEGGGATTAILTASRTPHDGRCDFKLSDPVEHVLPALRDRVLGH